MREGDFVKIILNICGCLQVLQCPSKQTDQSEGSKAKQYEEDTGERQKEEKVKTSFYANAPTGGLCNH